MTKYSMQYFLLTILIILFSVHTFSQNLPNDSIMAMNRKFKNEIGIDFQGFFKGTPGTASIWKRKKVDRLISLTFSRNYRFQIAFNGTLPISQTVTQVDTSKGHYLAVESKSFFI